MRAREHEAVLGAGASSSCCWPLQGAVPWRVHPLVWDVVCLAAVAALGLGLRLLFRVQAGAPAGLLGPPQCVCRAGAGGAGAVPADHPFLAASLAEEVAYGPPGCRGVARRLSRARFCG